MNQSTLAPFPPALAHGELQEVFEDVFFVSGAMETQLMGLDWKFSRNMTIVRDGERLVLINSIRLDDQGLAALDTLGKVTDVVRLGALHDRDDAFYLDRYDAQYWVTPGLEGEQANGTKLLGQEGALPVSNASLFQFESTQIPESILILNREGGIAIACDALQNWLTPDEHFCDDSCQRMTDMGFFTPANVGPVWQQAAQPDANDFKRLQTLSFKHALCGHGEPLRDKAEAAFSETFSRLFNC